MGNFCCGDESHITQSEPKDDRDIKMCTAITNEENSEELADWNNLNLEDPNRSFIKKILITDQEPDARDNFRTSKTHVLKK